MSTATNAFWREVLDFLPGLTLLFRIDDQEMTHLMFVTEAIRNELGFTPEEYVLASEDENTVVSSDLDKLIDIIAESSHRTDISLDPSCKLTDRTGQQLEYAFDFRLFRTKSAKQNLISVTLFPKGTIADKHAVNASASVPSPAENLFIAESQLTKDVLERIDTLSQQTMHVLIRGEQSVGKKTLAEKLAQKAAVLTGNQQVWVLNLPEVNKSMSPKQRLFAGIDQNNVEESLLDDIEKDLQLVIVELGLMNLDDQKDLLKLMATRTARGRKTRIIATSSESVEELMANGRIDASLVYKMSFVSVFVPPLRERVEDLLYVSMEYTKRIAQVLQLNPPQIDDRYVKRLMSTGIKGNFTELFDLLRASLLSGRVVIAEKSTGKKQDRVFFSVAGPAPYDEVSASYLEEVLRHTSGKIYGSDGAATILGMRPTTLQSKLKKLNVR
jgi:DNA-binding NtrC family response regulator